MNVPSAAILKPPGKGARLRWIICGLLFAADGDQLHRPADARRAEADAAADSRLDARRAYADIVFWFQAAYAIGYPRSSAGSIDRIGARCGFARRLRRLDARAYRPRAGSPSIAPVRHGALRARRSANPATFPAGCKAVAEWFPKRERALAIGIFNAGANIGAIVTPLIVPLVALAYGLARRLRRSPAWSASSGCSPGCSSTAARASTPRLERGGARLHRERSRRPGRARRRGRACSRLRETWAYALGKFLIDPIWWMFLFWLPDFLAKRYGLDLKTFGPPLVAIYLMLATSARSPAAGSRSRLIKRGCERQPRAQDDDAGLRPARWSRWPSPCSADNLWLAVLLIGLATAGHQGFSANLYTLPADVFPRSAVGSVVGIGGMVGAIGGMLMAKYAGWVLDNSAATRRSSSSPPQPICWRCSSFT